MIYNRQRVADEVAPAATIFMNYKVVAEPRQLAGIQHELLAGGEVLPGELRDGITPLAHCAALALEGGGAILDDQGHAQWGHGSLCLLVPDIHGIQHAVSRR